MGEMEASDEISKANEGEVGLVKLHVESLISSGLNPSEIAVITPYNLQVELIRLQLSSNYPGLEVRSVDGFQGREKEAVVLSLVRSNDRKEVGFLKESRRLNVAVTRAKRHVCLICNVETVSSDATLKTLIDHIEKSGEIRTAMQYEHQLRGIDIARPDGLALTVKEDSSKNPCEKKTKPKPREQKPISSKPGKSKQIDKPVKPLKNNQPKSFKTEDNKVDPSDDEERRLSLFKIVQDFVGSSNKSYDFPSSLNSRERLWVHEIAEEFQILHESQGEGKQRHIVLSKTGSKQVSAKEKKDNANEVSRLSTQESVQDSAKEKKKVDEVTCSSCLKSIPRQNIELHKLRCQPPKPQSKAKPTGTKIKKTKASKEEEDIDRLLESFNKLDTVCNAEKCKANVATLAQTCKFCRLRFCFNHGMPEIHGCGDAAKSAARQQISRDGKLYSGSGRPSHLPDPTRKAQLQFKMDKKMSEFNDNRSKKKPSKKSQ